MKNSLRLSDLARAVRRVCCSDLLGQSEAGVLIALLVHADGDGNCYPSLDRLARFSKVHRTTVIRTLERLRTLGLIRWEPGGGRGRANEYQLDVAALIALPETVAPCDRLPPETVAPCDGLGCGKGEESSPEPVENAGETVENSSTMHTKQSHDAQKTVAPCDPNGIKERETMNGNRNRNDLENPDPPAGRNADLGSRDATPPGDAVVHDAPDPGPSGGSELPAAARGEPLNERETENGNEERETPNGSGEREHANGFATGTDATPNVWGWLVQLRASHPSGAMRVILQRAEHKAAALAGGPNRPLGTIMSLEIEEFVLRQIASITGEVDAKSFADNDPEELFGTLRTKHGIPPLIAGGGKEPAA